MRYRRYGLALLFCANANAHDLTALPEVTSVAKKETRTSLGSEAAQLPAATVVLDSDDIAAMNISHVMDLFRTSGAVVRHINQGDVGDDFGLRGFAGGHGVDAAVFVDGIPVNQVNGRTHGLADLNWLLPQMIERIEITKGPFSARSGNFALGGVVNIVTRESLPGRQLDLSAGQYGFGQAVVGIGAGAPFVIAEAFSLDGYRGNAFSERGNLFGKHTLDLAGGTLSLVAQIDRRRFGAPGYLPVADVESGRRSRRDPINNSDGGDVDHAQLYLNFARSYDQHVELRARWYAIDDERSRYADFGTGQSATLTEGRTLGAGLDIEHYAEHWLLAGGIDLRYDDTERRAFRSTRRTPGATTSDRSAEAWQTGLYGEVQWLPTDSFKASLGIRYDRFDSDIRNRFNPGASGEGDADQLSPKFGVAWRPLAALEIYANRGRGLRSASQVELSPDVRGARFQDLQPFKVESTDIGLRWALNDRWTLDLNAYDTQTEGEFVQVAPGEFANLGSTTRDGVEGELRWRGEWLEAFFGASRVDAELVVASPARDVSGVPASSQVLGLTWRNGDYTVDAYAQRVGRAPLNASGSIVREPVMALSAKLSRQFQRFRAFAQFTFNPDDDRSETQFVINGANAFDPLPTVDAQIGVSYLF